MILFLWIPQSEPHHQLDCRSIWSTRTFQAGFYPGYLNSAHKKKPNGYSPPSHHRTAVIHAACAHMRSSVNCPLSTDNLRFPAFPPSTKHRFFRPAFSPATQLSTKHLRFDQAPTTDTVQNMPNQVIDDRVPRRVFPDPHSNPGEHLHRRFGQTPVRSIRTQPR